MRHLGSLALCLVLGPLIYLTTGYGTVKFSEGQLDLFRNDSSGYLTMTVSVVALTLAAGLYTLLILARLSPVGTVVAGLGLFGIAMWSMFGVRSFVDAMPNELVGTSGVATAAAGPIALLLSIPLLFTVFSPRRWRRWGNPTAAVAPSPGFAQPPAPYGGAGNAAPSYASPGGYGGPAYAAPSSGAPTYGAPSSGAPSYGAPSSGAPSYAAPSSGAPSYSTPSSGAPSYNAPASGAPSYNAPGSSAPSYTPPGSPAAASQQSPNDPTVEYPDKSGYDPDATRRL